MIRRCSAWVIVLYVGQLSSRRAPSRPSAPIPTQRRIMFALPFVFVIFIINFPAGLIVYWITTKLLDDRAAAARQEALSEARSRSTRAMRFSKQKPAARGKPAAAAVLTDGGSDAKAKPAAKAKGEDKGAGLGPSGMADRPRRQDDGTQGGQSHRIAAMLRWPWPRSSWSG